MPRTTSNESSFATAVLTELAKRTGNPYPVTAQNVQWIEQWATREGGGGANNPLNTTQATANSTLLAGNSAGVRNYANLDEGIQATVTTLLNGNYPNILSALRTGNALGADQQGQLSKDLLTWSGGLSNGQPNGKGYSTVANVTAKPVGSVGATGTDTGAANADGLTFDEWINLNEPGLSTLVNDPEIGPLLKSYYEGPSGGGISPDEFQTQLSQTQWWKNTPPDARANMVNAATDPATLAQALQNKNAYLRTLATQLGVPASSSQIASLAQQWQNNSGMSVDQLRSGLVGSAPITNTGLGGEAISDQQALALAYKNYMVPVSPQTLAAQTQQVLSDSSGKVLQGLQEQIAEQAKSLYSNNPVLSKYIDSTHTTADWVAPYVQHAATVLGTDPNSIDPTSPQWSFLTKPTTDPATGQTTGNALSLDDVTKQIQTNPVYGYSKTANGIARYTQMADALTKAFGGGSVS